MNLVLRYKLTITKIGTSEYAPGYSRTQVFVYKPDEARIIQSINALDEELPEFLEYKTEAILTEFYEVQYGTV